MDKNKLKEIDYKILPVCIFCKHGKFKFIGDDFGLCSKHAYEHLKHPEAERNLSVYKYGCCKEDFELDDKKKYLLEAFGQFLRL